MALNQERKPFFFDEMKILDHIKTLLFREAAAPAEKKTSPASVGALLSGQLIADRPTAVATVFRCVRILSDSVASLQMQCMRREGGRYVEDERSPFHYLLHVQPQPERSVYDFWAMAVQQMVMEGNAYIYPRRGERGEVSDLVLCSPHTVSHDSLNGTYAVSDPYNGVYGTFREAEMIHIFLYSSNGRDGESVLHHARRTIGIAAAGDEETRNRFSNGGTVRGLVSNDRSVQGFGEYQDEQLSAAAEDIDGRFQSGERIVSLPGQVDFKQISLSSTDMQFLESRKFTVREICRFFGVNPSHVFDDTSNNYKSAEMAGMAYLQMTLDPILKRIEAEFNRKLVPREMCCERVFRFDRRGVFSLDLASLAAYQKATIESGIYTVNEWREIENQPRVEGGDEPLVSANLLPLAQIRQKYNGKQGENN